MYVLKYITITHDIVYSYYSRVLWFGDVSYFHIWQVFVILIFFNGDTAVLHDAW